MAMEDRYHIGVNVTSSEKNKFSFVLKIPVGSSTEVLMFGDYPSSPPRPKG